MGRAAHEDGRRAGGGRRPAALPVAVATLSLGLSGCGLWSPWPAPRPTSPGPAAASSAPGADGTAVTRTATFKAVIDGDTVSTSAGTVRLIGIDTPERGECGHDEASAELGRLLSRGDPVTLELPAGQNDHDRHGRLVRYLITAAGTDLGLVQLEAGHALARYDSTDGYPAHPRQAAYHAAQLASAGADGAVVTTACQGGIVPAADLPQGPWWEQYASCGKLKRNTVGHPTGPFSRDDPTEAEIYEWFAHRTGNNGDGDGDGLACE